ncbi:MAG: hypothetical protein KG003_07650, partial [Bacteroidetes bacterium]|nr:hypothetical protein [Bacteroidota bacterium]
NKLNELGFIYFYYLNAVGYQQQSQASSYLLGAYTQITTIPNLPTTSSSLQFGRAGIGFFFVQKAGFSNPLKSAIMNGAATSTISQLYDIVQIKMYGNYVNYMIVGSSFAGISSTALLRTS